MVDEEIITMNDVKKVEDFIKSIDVELDRKKLVAELKSIIKDESKIKNIIEYLERSGKILFTKAGVIWTCIDNYRLKEVINRGVFV